MKCENCGNELVGAAIVCRQCNHNNAQGRVNQWRARRTGELQKPATRSLSPLANHPSLEVEEPKPSNSKPLEPRTHPSLPFESRTRINPGSTSSANSQPVSSYTTPAGHNEIDRGVIQYPAWRAELKEKVRQVRERNGTTAQALDIEPDEAQLDPNPIVESALKRIRWSNGAPPVTTLSRGVRHGAQATALAVEEDIAAYTAEVTVTNPPVTSEAEVRAESRHDNKPPTHVTTNTVDPLPGQQPARFVNQAEAKSKAPEQERVQKPESKPQVTTKSETRFAIPPASKPAAKTVTNRLATPKPAEQKVRTTGEIKRPQSSPVIQAPAGKPPKSTTVAVPPSQQVETQVIGLSPSVSTVAGYVTIGAAMRPRTRTAALWVRTLAGAVDFEIIGLAYYPLFYSFATLNTSMGNKSYALMFVLLAVLTFCYQILTLSLAERTSGMAFLQLRLVNLADIESPISRGQLMARAAAATAAFLCPPLNLIVMQSNHHRDSLPDLFSGTTLIEKSSSH